MGKEISDMLSKSIKEFNSFCDIDEKEIIEKVRAWMKEFTIGIALPQDIKTRDELILHTKGLALWYPLVNRHESSNIISSIVETMNNKTSPNEEGAKHHIRTFEKYEKVYEEDVVKSIVIISGYFKSSREDVYYADITLEELLVGDKHYKYHFVKKIPQLAFMHGVNINVLIYCITLVSYFEILEYSRIDIDKINITENRKNNLKKILKRHTGSTQDATFMSICSMASLEYNKIMNMLSKDNLLEVYTHEQMQIFLNNSFDTAIEALTPDNVEQLPLDQYKLNFSNTVDDIERIKNGLNQLFTKPSSLKQLEAGKHYMKFLQKEKVIIKNDKVVYKGFSEALEIGYTEKGILLSLDKNKALRELKKSLQVLKKYNNKDSQELTFTQTLIDIIGQKKSYTNMIPYKAISEQCGMTKKNVIQYARLLYGKKNSTIRRTTFDSFDEAKIHDFRKKNK